MYKEDIRKKDHHHPGQAGIINHFNFFCLDVEEMIGDHTVQYGVDWIYFILIESFFLRIKLSYVQNVQ